MAASLEPFYADLGRRLLDLREKRGLTQAALGRRLPKPMTRASIANVESGKQRVLAHTLVDLAHALEVPISDLLATPEVHVPKPAQIEDELRSKLAVSETEAKSMLAKIAKAQGRKR